MSLQEVLHVEEVSPGVFEGRPRGRGFMFGGLTLGLALGAAGHTVRAGMVAKSFHAYFLRTGEWGEPTTLEVEQITEGRTLCTREIKVTQAGKKLATMIASFHVPGTGADWQASTPAVVAEPGDLEPDPVGLAAPDLMEVRPLVAPPAGQTVKSLHPYWARPIGPLGDDPIDGARALAFISDYLVVGAVRSVGPDVIDRDTIRTLDHSVWFHRPFKAEHWALFSAEPLSVVEGRGFVRGSVHQNGTLVASFAQEVILLDWDGRR